MNHHERHHAAPTRACIACRQRRPATELVRFVREGRRVVPDLRRRRGGRGAHTCATIPCFERAIARRAFPRALRGPVDVDLETLLEDVRAAACEGLGALLREGRRSRDVVDVPAERVAPAELKSLTDRLAHRGGPERVPYVAVQAPALASRVGRLATVLDRLQSRDPVL